MDINDWRQLRDAGLTPTAITDKLRAGTLHRVRRGAYVAQGFPDPESHHRAQILATGRLLAPDAVLSHASAAILHGLPVPRAWLGRVYVTREAKRNARLSSGVKTVYGPLPTYSVDLVEGLAVTSIPRTVVDVARLGSHQDAQAVVDAALRMGFAKGDFAAELTLAKRCKGVPKARTAVEYGDANAESPGESWSRAIMMAEGLPLPLLQQEIFDQHGLIGRVDFLWEEFKIVGEFDGHIKYSGAFGDPAEIIRRQRARDERLRRAGYLVVHFTVDDLADPIAFASLIRQAILTVKAA